MRNLNEDWESFFVRLQPIMTQKEILDVELAYILAKGVHARQERKGEIDPETGLPVRYFEHLRGSTLVSLDRIGVRERDLVIAQLLHDGPEDTERLHHALIEHTFGVGVSSIVRLVTKRPVEGYARRLHMHGDWRTGLVKLADNSDNIASLTGMAPDKQLKQAQKSKTKYFPIFDSLLPALKKHRPVYFAGATEVYDEIKCTVARIEREYRATA